MEEVPVLELRPVLGEASLLGLPRELRLEIYHHVFALDLDHTALHQWRDTHSALYGFKSVPDLNKDDKLMVPWLNLSRSCKAIRFEVHGLMKQSSFLGDDRNRTYVLDLEPSRGGMTLGKTTWQRIPCAPAQVQRLEAHYNASRGFQAWGVGGPHGITSGLYQTLNHFIHCGPRFKSACILEEPMHLKELLIFVESRGPEDENNKHSHYTLSDRETDPETTLYALGSIVGQINRTGVLRGFVDNIRASTGDKCLQWTTEDSEGSGIPEYWDRYGFDWGMELYRED